MNYSIYLKCLKLYGAIAVLIGVVSCHGDEKEATAVEQVDKGVEDAEPLVEVIAEKVKKQAVFDPLLFAGTVFSKKTSKVYSPVEGAIEKIFVSAGKPVKKGQKLLSIRPTGLRGQYNSSLITAPQSGVFVGPIFDPFDYIKANQLAVAVADTSDKRVRIHVPRKEYDLITTLDNQTVIEVLTKTPSSNETEKEKFSGEVVFSSPTINPKTLSHEVEVQLSCKTSTDSSVCMANLEKLPIHSFVYVRLGTKYRESIVLSANILEGNRDHVFVLKKSKSKESTSFSVAKNTIKLGDDLGGKFEVVEGLEEGDEVVVSYSKKPKDGQEVSVQKMKPSEKKM